MVCNTEGCERTAVLKGQCNPCYQRAYYATNRDQWRPGGRYYREPEGRKRDLTLAPCTYAEAHKRTRRRRGPASGYTCRCGKPAEQWAYRGGSELEQCGDRIVYGRNRRVVYAQWSPDPADYDPLCTRCHADADGRLYHGS
jgi:hypothetical protein